MKKQETRNKHLSRKELIEVARGQRNAQAEHLRNCTVCSDLVEIYEGFPVVGEKLLGNVPSGWINRASAIMQPKRLKQVIQQLVASLSFDSWSQSTAVVVRSEIERSSRRFRYNADDYSIEIGIEKRQTEYSFIATVSKESHRDSSFVLVSAGRSIMADEDGYYHWVSSRPPKRISLHSSNIVIHLPVTSWNTPS